VNDRYVIALRSEFDFADPVLDLPDVEHIHLTRLPDGRWTAVAMEKEDRGHRDYCYAVVDGGSCDCDYPFRPVRWVDVPTEPEEAGA
jgi:hypothetical protein